ncbi:MAG: hypothetical protein K2K97_07620 [Muribaculaceae bacterium]|nr:hypothetical protein [Muribaculaceae bacterium]
MNKRQKTVMSMLKPKVKAFGFTQKELQGIAAQIADNLTSEDDASDEDVNAEIGKAIEAVLPILRLGQSYANRVINDSKKNEDEDNDDDEVEDDESSKPSKPNRSPKSKGKKSDDVPVWAQALIDSNKYLSDQLAALKGEKISDRRKAKLEKLLKDTGKYGERILRDYARMTFKDDEAFDEYFSDVEEDLKSENQERANKGLEKLGAPATGGSVKKDKKPEVLSDEEIKEIAKS